MVVNFMNRMLENLPSLIGVFRIDDDAVLEGLYLEIPLLLITHRIESRNTPIHTILGREQKIGGEEEVD